MLMVPMRPRLPTVAKSVAMNMRMTVIRLKRSVKMSRSSLALRMERHASNAATLASFLNAHPQVKKVIYPGLRSHPQHALASRQMSGYGGMISFVLDGSLAKAKTFVESTKIFALAESLGGVESLIELPAIMTHAAVPEEVRHSIGIEDGLVRLSVGIEHVEDQLVDLEQAFIAASKVS